MTQQSPSGLNHVGNPMEATTAPVMPQRPLLTPLQPDQYPWDGNGSVSNIRTRTRACLTQQEVDLDFGSDDDSTTRRSSENGSSERSSSFNRLEFDYQPTGYWGKFHQHSNEETSRKDAIRPQGIRSLLRREVLLNGFTLQAVCLQSLAGLFALGWNALHGHLRSGEYHWDMWFVKVDTLWILSLVLIAFVVCGVALTLCSGRWRPISDSNYASLL